MSEETAEIANLAPPLTPEQLAANEEFQKQMRSRFRAPQSANRTDYARRVIEGNLRVLAILQDQFGKQKDENIKFAISEKARAIKIDVCLWLLQIGKFTEAANLCPEENQAEIYRLYAEAEAADDSHWCEHPRWIEGANNQPQPNYYVEIEYFSEKRARSAAMTRCAVCQMRNAVDLPADLIKLDRERQKLVVKFREQA